MQWQPLALLEGVVVQNFLAGTAGFNSGKGRIIVFVKWFKPGHVRVEH